ncbi:MAG TPA: aminodeoxychorismate/anthranilate synthase component II [Phycisphaerae bacterium]|nr:aminodeoxychorismate/anthranilate synthase component II [Phycisphaerae bacterium]
MILIVDNYDSFTYNLVQRIGELDAAREVRVFRNDAITPDGIADLAPSHIILSPGPCTPNEAGISVEVVQRFAGQVPLLGVCLGHQAIAQAFGGRIIRADRLMHGKTSEIYHDGKGVYAGLPNPFTATRYHSLTVARETLPAEFEISAWTERDELMGIRHRDLPVDGVQFHPESFLTKHGHHLLANFLGLEPPPNR